MFLVQRDYIQLENNLVFKSIMDGVNASHEFSTHIWKSIKWNKEGKA